MSNQGPVVLFTGGLGGDGVARNTVHLANALAQRGVNVVVVCLEAGPLQATLQGAVVHCLGRNSKSRGVALAAAVPAFTACLRRLRPSAVVSMGNHAHLAAWAALRRLPQAPRIYRISNEPAHDGRRTLSDRLRTAGLRLIAADATRLVCVSRSVAESESLGCARLAQRVDVLPNGVDVGQVRTHAHAPVHHAWLAEKQVTLVAVGRVHPQKNYGVLIDALAIIRRTRPDVRLIILGAAPAKRRAALAARAAQLKLVDAIRFEGEIANPFPFIRAASTYVLPSLWEGASNSLLEALACGVPVVAAWQAGNATQVLRDGAYGRLADGADAVDVACQILLQLDPRPQIRPGGRAAAFDLAAVTPRFCEIIAGAIAEHRALPRLSAQRRTCEVQAAPQ